MTAERRSTAAARFSMLMPLERRTRPASTEVRRSSQSLTGRRVRFSSAAANSRTHTDCRPSVPRILMGLPSRIMPTSRWRMSCSSRSRSVRMRVRTRLGRPCAVMPKGSLMASPMRRLPRSRARIRVKAGVKQFHYRLVRATVETKVVYRAVAVVTQPSSSTTSVVREARHIALPILALGVVIAILYLGRLFFITSLIALTIAFILEPFVALLMRIRFPRSLASFVVCSFALALLYVIGLGAYSQLSGLYEELPKYGQSIADLVDGFRQRISGMEDQTYKMLVPARQRQEEERRKQLEQLLAAAKKSTKKGAPQAPQSAPAPGVAGAIPEVRIHEESTPIGDYIYSRLSSLYQVLLMFSFIPFLVYFMLSWRDHINRAFLQFFRGEDRLVAARSVQGIADMVRAFVVGNFVLGVLLAVLSSVLFWSMRVPYPLLVGPLSGVMSLVPYIGLPLAMIPPLFAALPLNAVPVYVLVVMTVATLHLFALNVLYPKIVGSRVHLNPLVVTFSLMIWGFLWDAPGLLLAIPLTAGIKAVCDNVKGLRAFGKFLGD